MSTTTSLRQLDPKKCVHMLKLLFIFIPHVFCFLSGARNETEKLLLESLHAVSLPCYHHILGGLLPHFRNRSLEVAARMYLRPGFDVKLPFVEDSLARYQ